MDRNILLYVPLLISIYVYIWTISTNVTEMVFEYRHVEAKWRKEGFDVPCNLDMVKNYIEN